MSEAQEIAARLTEAQRRLVLWLGAESYRDWGETNAPGNKRTRDVVCHLTERGAMPWMRRLTPLGLEVRKILEAQS